MFKRAMVFVVASTMTFQVASASAQVPPPEVAKCEVGVAAFSKTAKDAYAYKHWKHGPSKAAQQRIKRQLKCAASPKARQKMNSILAEQREDLHLYKRYRQVTPFPGVHEGDIWLEHLAVPAWVVQAETRGYSGQGRWNAQNGSGACGPYQLLGHTSCAVNSPRDKVRHHIVAAGLPRGSWAVGYSTSSMVTPVLLSQPDVYWWSQASVIKGSKS